MMENVEELGIKTNTSKQIVLNKFIETKISTKGKDQKMDHQREAERGLTD